MDIISIIASVAPELAETIRKFNLKKVDEQQLIILAVLTQEIRDMNKKLDGIAEFEKLNSKKLDLLLEREH